MMIYAIGLWFLAAPMGFVTGKCWSDDPEDLVMPLVCALVPPLGALVACLLIIQEETEE